MQMFPQLDPWNVWNLPHDLWEVLAQMADRVIAEARKGVT